MSTPPEIKLSVFFEKDADADTIETDFNKMGIDPSSDIVHILMKWVKNGIK